MLTVGLSVHPSVRLSVTRMQSRMLNKCNISEMMQDKRHDCYVTDNCNTGSILSVESNQNMESKTKNVESKTEKCGVQNSIFTSRNQLF